MSSFLVADSSCGGAAVLLVPGLALLGDMADLARVFLPAAAAATGLCPQLSPQDCMLKQLLESVTDVVFLCGVSADLHPGKAAVP